MSLQIAYELTGPQRDPLQTLLREGIFPTGQHPPWRELPVFLQGVGVVAPAPASGDGLSVSVLPVTPVTVTGGTSAGS